MAVVKASKATIDCFKFSLESGFIFLIMEINSRIFSPYMGLHKSMKEISSVKLDYLFEDCLITESSDRSIGLIRP